MLRIPLEVFKTAPYDDQDVIRAWQWFMSFFPAKKWQERKASIEKRISMEFRDSPPFSEPISNGTAMVIKDDQIGWYLYLIEVLIKEPQKYEFFQGSRVVPLFKRVGIDLALLNEIGGVGSKVRNLINKRMSEADAILFELLSALVWARNGWQVTFLKEQSSTKTPDFIAEKGSEKWYVECKRQSKTSDYAQQERVKWQKMIAPLKRTLIEHNLLLDIVFHVELSTLPDTFLSDLLSNKLPLVVQPGKIVSNEAIDVGLSFVHMRAIKDHLSRFFVKYPSPQMSELIGGKPADNVGFTSGAKVKLMRVGDGEVNNLYASDIQQAYGVFWQCDAKEAIVAKARDIKKQIVSALEQFQPEHNAVIHIGMETFDGPKVEQERVLKITDTLAQLNPKGKNLCWAYCHYFQAYSHVTETWTFDETVTTISSNPPKGGPPLPSHFLIVPDEVVIDNLSHWERPLP